VENVAWSFHPLQDWRHAKFNWQKIKYMNEINESFSKKTGWTLAKAYQS